MPEKGTSPSFAPKSHSNSSLPHLHGVSPDQQAEAPASYLLVFVNLDHTFAEYGLQSFWGPKNLSLPKSAKLSFAFHSVPMCTRMLEQHVCRFLLLNPTHLHYPSHCE